MHRVNQQPSSSQSTYGSSSTGQSGSKPIDRLTDGGAGNPESKKPKIISIPPRPNTWSFHPIDRISDRRTHYTKDADQARRADANAKLDYTKWYARTNESAR